MGKPGCQDWRSQPPRPTLHLAAHQQKPPAGCPPCTPRATSPHNTTTPGTTFTASAEQNDNLMQTAKLRRPPFHTQNSTEEFGTATGASPQGPLSTLTGASPLGPLSALTGARPQGPLSTLTGGEPAGPPVSTHRGAPTGPPVNSNRGELAGPPVSTYRGAPPGPPVNFSARQQTPLPAGQLCRRCTSRCALDLDHG